MLKIKNGYANKWMKNNDMLSGSEEYFAICDSGLFRLWKDEYGFDYSKFTLINDRSFTWKLIGSIPTFKEAVEFHKVCIKR